MCCMHLVGDDKLSPKSITKLYFVLLFIMFIQVSGCVATDPYERNCDVPETDVNATKHKASGIILNGASESIIQSCVCNENADHGIFVIYASGTTFATSTEEVTLIGNTCINNGYTGIQVSDSSDVTIEANNCRHNDRQGIRLNRSEGCSVIANKCVQAGGGDATFSGIFVNESEYCIVSGNTSKENGNIGIYLGSSNRCIVSGNTCSGNGGSGIRAGTSTRESSDNTVTGNECIGNALYGIGVTGHQNTLTGNSCNENQSGIAVFTATYNNVQSNMCADNDEYGIYLGVNSANNFVTNNDLIGNLLGGIDDNGTSNATTPGNRS